MLTVTLFLEWKIKMHMKLVFLLCLQLLISNDSLATGELENQTPEEIQHAVCKIDTEQIKASANATITRQLKGVCSTRDLNRRLDHLENLLVKEINSIKDMLRNVGLTIPKMARNLQSPTAFADSEDNVEDYEEDEEYANEIIQKEEKVETKIINPPPNIAPYVTPLEEGAQATQKPPVMSVYQNEDLNSSNVIDSQIRKFNASTQTLSLGRVFYYYWKISGIDKIFKQEDVPFKSPEFNFNGHQLHMKLTPHHFGSQYVNIELKGNIVYKHRFTIIDQKDSKNDITSQMLANMFNYPKAYRITHSKMDSYIINNQLLIKVLIYLDL